MREYRRHDYKIAALLCGMSAWGSRVPKISTMIPNQTVYRTIGLLLLISVPFIECNNIHELMTEDEIFKIFHTTPDKIPEYEIVAIEHSLYKRSSPQDFRLKFKAFDKDVDVYLNPNEGFLVGEYTPVWLAEYSVNATHYRQLKQKIMKEVLGVYQSVPGRAALVVRARNDEGLQFDGTVEDLSVIPLPPRVQQKIKKNNKNKRDLPSTGRTMMITEYHIVFKSKTGFNQTDGIQQSNESTVDNNQDITNQIDVSRSKRDDKDVVFPTILVTTDFDVAVKSNDDNEFYDQIIYQLAFWNAVDLKYRHLSNPKVHLRIAGFVIGYGRSATPYMKRNTVNDEVNTFSALQDMRAYWNQMRHNGEFSPDGFHIVTTATNLKMTGVIKGKKTTLGGLAAMASICAEYGNRFYPAAIFKDDLAFGGVNVAVHELGHILGTNHDDLRLNKCPSSGGYLMAPILSSTVNNPKWSKCSLNALAMNLRFSSCVDKPKEYYPTGNPLGKILPGTLKTTHEQCQARGYDWACETTPDVCRILKCYYTGFYGFFATLLMCQNSPSAAEGTECAPGRVCLDGECKSLHPLENP